MYNSRSTWLPLISTVILAIGLWFVTFFLTWGNFWVKISCSALTLAALSLWLQPEREIGQFSLKSVLIGLISAVLLYLIFWLGKTLSINLFGFAQHQIGSIYDKGTGSTTWFIALLLLFVTGPSEELYWRGYLQRQLMQRWGNWQGWLVAASIYAGVHIWSFNFMLAGAAAVAGLFWGAMYWRLGHLTPVIISHSVWSAVVFTVLPLN